MPNSNQATLIEIDQTNVDQLKKQLIEDLNKIGIPKITYNSGKLDKVINFLSATNVSNITELEKIKNELSSLTTDLIKLIDSIGNNPSESDQIIFNQNASKLVLKLSGIGVKKDNSEFLIALKEQLEKLDISKLMLFSCVTNKIDELSKLQVELDFFVNEKYKKRGFKKYYYGSTYHY